MAGYSMRVVMALQNADSELPEIQFGRFCVRNNIPVDRIAAELGVSRMTVYNWFLRGVRAKAGAVERMQELVSGGAWTTA